MSMGFYLRSAFRNIWNNKRQSSIYLIGIIVSITVISSLTIWSAKSEDFATLDFLNSQDYELKVRSYLTDRLPDIKDWLDAEPIIESTDFLYYNLAFFNAEEKDPFYRFWPLEDQDDNSDPVTLATLFLFPEESIERFQSQFQVRGSWDLDVGEVLISENQATQIELAMNMTVEPGTVLNLTIARQSVDFGIYLFQYEPISFYNITVKGIYTKINSISMLQQSFSEDFIENSIFFLTENLIESDIERFWDNGLTPILAAKCKSDELSKDGIANIVPTLENIEERLTVEVTTAVVDLLDSPFYQLEQSYSKAKTYVVVMIPVILLGIIQTLFSTNIILEKRQLEIEIYQEKGGQKRQIIGALLLEFAILSISATVIALVLSWFMSALIPSIASMSFNMDIFLSLLSSFKFQIWPIALSACATIIISLVFATLKINQILTRDLSERDLIFRNKFQKWTLIGLLIVSIVGIIGIFIFFLIRLQNDITGIFNYSIYNTQDSSILFSLLAAILILFSIGAAIGIFILLGKIKKFYTILMRKNSFFLINNLKQSRFKFNALLVVMLVLVSSTVYSITLLKSINNTQEAYNYYNNGADLRINTYDAPINFSTTIEQIEGIETVMPIVRASGKFGYETLTLYGINITKYAEIGRWDSSSYPYNLYAENSSYDVLSWLSVLHEHNDSAIVADGMASLYEVNLEDEITLTNLPVGASYGSDKYTVKGFIHSAPGLGLAKGANLQLDQPSESFMLVNDFKLIDEYGLTTANLFFASISDTADIDVVIAELLEENLVFEINPNLESEGFADKYVNNYVPSLSIFLIIQIVLANFVGVLIILMNTNFILAQRKQKIAILNTLGNSNRNLMRMIFQELAIINGSVILLGLVISLPLAFITTKLIQPFVVDKLIMPLTFSVDYLMTTIFFVLLILITLLAAVPTIIRDRSEKISTAIQDETSSAY